jgi:hypothetical protein
MKKLFLKRIEQIKDCRMAVAYRMKKEEKAEMREIMKKMDLINENMSEREIEGLEIIRKILDKN